MPPGESLEFLAQTSGVAIGGARERVCCLLVLNLVSSWKRKAYLLQLNDIGLRVALGHAIGTNVFFIPKAHFAKEIPEQGDEGWWYQVRSVMMMFLQKQKIDLRCREC